MSKIPKAIPIYGERKVPVFVGREKDLVEFEENWSDASEEFSVIKIANMPGIGKTEVVKQFFRTYGMREREDGNFKEQALLIHLNCKIIANSIDEIQNPEGAYELTQKMMKFIVPQLNFYYQQIGEKFPDDLNAIIDYTTEEEISTWINALKWDKMPHVSDLVEAGLMLRGNGNVVDDYTQHHSEQYRPENPIVLVSKHVHNTMRKKFIDNIWLEEIKITQDTQNILKISPSVVGFAFEYYFALKIMQISQNDFEFISNGKSPYLTNMKNIKLPVNNLVFSELEYLLAYVSIDAINPIEKNRIYLLSTETAIDGFIALDNVNLLYQCKFTRNKPSFDESFFIYFEDHARKIEQKTSNPVIKVIFTYREPSRSSIEKLNRANILINSDLKLLLGDQMVKWLEDAKNSTIYQ